MVSTSSYQTTDQLGVTSKKKNSIFVDIIQIEVDPPPSYPNFDKLFFDKVLMMLTSLPPFKFLTKPCNFKVLIDIIYCQIIHLHSVSESLNYRKL